MKKLLTAAAVVASLGVALPAAAQTWGGGYGGGYNNGGYGAGYNNGGFRGDSAERIENRIERGVRDGSLTPNEARSLSRQLQDVRRLEWQYSRNGLSAGEARELDRRYASLTARLRLERRDRDTRFDDYGRGYDRDYGRNGYGYR